MIKSNLRKGMKVLFLLIVLISSMPIVPTDHQETNENSTTEFSEQMLKSEMPIKFNQIEKNVEEETPNVISLDGSNIGSIPDFVHESENLHSSIVPAPGFQIASESDPNITRIYFQNFTGGVPGNRTTWMQSGGRVRIWFEVKGPIYVSGSIVTVSFDRVVSRSSAYGSLMGAVDLNSYGDIGVNETQWFSWTWTLPDEASGNYGWSPGLVNAFTLRLYHPILYPVVTPYYEGLYDKYSYLNMYGEVRVKRVQWYNLTGDNGIKVAQKGWYVSPWFTIAIDNAPVWGVSFQTAWWADVVWWLDAYIGSSAINLVAEKIYPGNYSVYPRVSPGASSWLFYQIDPNSVYGTGIGQRRGIYCKLFVSGNEIYSSNNEGALLYVVDEILKQPPSIQVVSPLDGEVFTESSLELDAFISDPNSNYDIELVTLYNDGAPTDVTSIYNRNQGRLTTTVSLPQNSAIVNLTIYARDKAGLESIRTILVLSDNPAAYFPVGFNTDSVHYSLPFSQQLFALDQRFTFEPGEDVNITLTPRATFSVTPSIQFDLYTGVPSSVSAGDEYTTYIMVSNPRVSLTVDFTLEVDYYLKLLTWEQQGSVVLFSKSWSASTSLFLGVEVLDLRYDLPGISEYIQPFTHYEIDFLSVFPIISDFASVKLSIDFVPLLKIVNVLSSDIIGMDCSPLLSEISFVSERMFAVQSTVADTVSGSTCELQFTNLAMDTTLGFDLSADLWLSGSVVGFTIVEVNLNDWLYEQLGIVVPSLSIWHPVMSIPLAGTVSVPTSIEPQQLQPSFAGLSADESYINVTLQVVDEHENAIAMAVVVATIGAESLTVIDVGGGQYLIQVPYRDTGFTLSVICSKSGYDSNSGSFEIYVDPMTVDSTPPSVSNVEIEPDQPSEDVSVTVSASIVDSLSGVSDCTLYYSVDGGASWQSVAMELIVGTRYEATIPAQAAATTVLYYFQVSDGAGNVIATDQISYIVQSATTTTETTTGTATTTTSDGTTTGVVTPDGTMLLIVGAGVAGVLAVVIVGFVLKKRE